MAPTLGREAPSTARRMLAIARWLGTHIRANLANFMASKV